LGNDQPGLGLLEQVVVVEKAVEGLTECKFVAGHKAVQQRCTPRVRSSEGTSLCWFARVRGVRRAATLVLGSRMYSRTTAESNVATALLGLAMGLLPLSVSLNALAVALLVLHTALRASLAGAWRARYANLRARPAAFALVLAAVGYVLWAALSLLWTRNLPHGLQDLRTVAPLALVLLAVAFGPTLSATQRRIILGAFTLGTLVLVGLAVADAAPRPGGPERFFYHSLISQRNVHAIFAAHFAATGLLCLPLGYSPQRNGWVRTAVLGSLALALVAALVLLASRMTLGALVAVGALAVITTQVRRPRARLLGAAAVLSLVVLGAVLAPRALTQRFASLMDHGWEYTWKNPSADWAPELPNELAMRLIAWRVAADELTQREAWIGGVGIGDMQDVMAWGWFESRLWHFYLEHNAHGQYVQTLLGQGVIGLLLLLALLLAALRTARGTQLEARLGQLWVIFLALTWLTESSLVRQHGLMFAALGLAVLVLSPALAADSPGDTTAQRTPE